MNKRIRRVVLFFAVLVLLSGIAKRAYGAWRPEIGTTPLLWQTSLTTRRLDGIKPVISDWIEKLTMCESGGRWNIKVMDSNDKYSYSGLQFQKSTFLAMVEKYGLLREAEARERENFLMDKDTQIELASRMLKEKDGWKNWYNCGLRIGLDKVSY